ncbi:GHMP family kinase ATP-binding protein [Sorangium sp. So ce1389]|uniref:GHMP family kinase ATP-binding protein n=1 Tax=Sorangium sp. So ce1389 TaxID=3133336 RepID=UPI003F63F60F
MSTPCAGSLSAPRSPRSPLWRAAASAPMRVSFAGGGSDLPGVARQDGGRVVGAAVDLRVRVIVEPFDRGWVRMELAALGQATSAEGAEAGDGTAGGARAGDATAGGARAGGARAGDAAAGDEKASAPRVITRRRTDPPRDDLAFRLLEATLAATGVGDGVALRVETEMSPGAGLGGSASAAVAALFALRAAVGEAAAPEELAREAVAIERERLHNACGAQDQVFAAFGGLLDLAFDDRGCSGVRPLAIGCPDLVPALSAGLLLVDTAVRRVSGEVLDRVDAGAAFDAQAELVAAAGEVARGFELGALALVLSGMRRGAAAKVRLSAAANAIAVSLQRRLDGLGVEVLRMCGAGGGGHLVLWAPPERHARILDALGPCLVRRPALGAPGVRLDPG